MTTSVNYAVHNAPGRVEALKRSIASIVDQVDIVRVYWNNLEPVFIHDKVINLTGPDKTDNGKFAGVPFVTDEHFFSCDCDIIYPNDYVYKTLGVMEEHQLAVVSYHGRQIVNSDVIHTNYYYGKHRVYSYLNEVTELTPVDIVGTGVCCTDTRFFRPLRVKDSKFICMSDLVFSLAAAKEGIDLFVAPHPSGWFEPIRFHNNIYNIFKNKDQTEQASHVVEIARIKGII